MKDVEALSDRSMFALTYAKAEECIKHTGKLSVEHEKFHAILRDFSARVEALEAIINHLSEGL